MWNMLMSCRTLGISDMSARRKREGIVSGISDTLFGAGQNILRQDMAVMIWRVLSDMEVQPSGDDTPFADDGEIAEYALEAVYKLKAFGIVQGNENNFSPQEKLTRAEAAVVISALYSIITG